MRLSPILALGLFLAACNQPRSLGVSNDPKTPEIQSQPSSAASFPVSSLPWLDLSDPRAIEIDKLMDLRSDGNGRLQVLANDEQPAVRARACLALGHLRDSKYTEALSDCVTDKDSDVRRLGSFAISLLGEKADQAAIQALLTQLLVEDNLEVRRALLRALAYSAPVAEASKQAPTSLPASTSLPSSQQVSPLDVMLSNLADPESRASAALALGLFAQRGAKLPDTAVTALESLLDAPSVETRYAAVYALMRGKLVSARLTTIAEKDTDAEVRATAARALGNAFGSKIFDPTQLEAVLTRLSNDSDWRVRVEAVRALAKGGAALLPALDKTVLALFKTISSDAALLSGPSLHAVLAGLEVIEPLLTSKTELPGLTEMASLSDLATSPLAKTAAADLAAVQCQVAFLLDLNDLQAANLKPLAADVSLSAMLPTARLPRCGRPEDAWRRGTLSAKLWAAIAKKSPSDALKGLSALLGDADARVRAATVEAFGDLNTPEVAALLRKTLADKDLAVSSTAVDMVKKRAGDKNVDPEAVSALIALLDVYTSPVDAESIALVYATLALVATPTSTGIEEALLRGEADASLTIREAAAKARKTLFPLASSQPSSQTTSQAAVRPLPASPKKGPVSGEPVAVPKPGTKAIVETSRGSITLSLLVDVAPRTCANFASLAQSGYFNGLSFHRVVSSFVAQGGDPRGDGWGGPGYAIRDELSPERFTRGAVGMALGGPDTAGSQWFVMHTWHPHLDGRYPLFAKVLTGQEVVDSLQIGDKIKSIQVIAP